MPSPGAPIPKTSSFTLTRWVTLALASGAFAALNGLFAKLFVHRTSLISIHDRLANTCVKNRTTTEATGSTANSIAHALKLPEGVVEVIVRAVRSLHHFVLPSIQLKANSLMG